jgi:hypothetical protein
MVCGILSDGIGLVGWFCKICDTCEISYELAGLNDMIYWSWQRHHVIMQASMYTENVVDIQREQTAALETFVIRLLDKNDLAQQC